MVSVTNREEEAISRPHQQKEKHGPVLSVIVVTWNGKQLVWTCLTSIQRWLEGVSHEVIVVDNASSDGTAEMVEAEFPRVRLIRNQRNLGFGAGNNAGMAVAQGECFLLLNSDARLIDETPARLVAQLRSRGEVGIIGPRLRFEDGRLQASAHRFGSFWSLLIEECGFYKFLSKERVANLFLGGYWDHEGEREVDWVTGACMLVRREVFEETGGFDAGIFLYGEEVEWCRRIRARGWSVLFSPIGEVVHVGHASADELLGEEGRFDRCLIATDGLMRREHGRVAGALAPVVRIAGALLKLSVFSSARVRKRDESYARAVRHSCKMVLRHYLRRVLGQVGNGAGPFGETG